MPFVDKEDDEDYWDVVDDEDVTDGAGVEEVDEDGNELATPSDDLMPELPDEEEN